MFYQKRNCVYPTFITGNCHPLQFSSSVGQSQPSVGIKKRLCFCRLSSFCCSVRNVIILLLSTTEVVVKTLFLYFCDHFYHTSSFHLWDLYLGSLFHILFYLFILIILITLAYILDWFLIRKFSIIVWHLFFHMNFRLF